MCSPYDSKCLYLSNPWLYCLIQIPWEEKSWVWGILIYSSVPEKKTQIRFWKKKTADGIATETLPGTGIPSCPGGIHLEDACRVRQLVANMFRMKFLIYERHDSNRWRVARWALHPLRSLPAKGFNDHALEAIEPQCQGAPNTCLVWVMVLVMVTGVVRTKGKRIWLIIVKQCYLSRKNTTKSGRFSSVLLKVLLEWTLPPTRSLLFASGPHLLGDTQRNGATGTAPGTCSVPAWMKKCKQWVQILVW